MQPSQAIILGVALGLLALSLVINHFDKRNPDAPPLVTAHLPLTLKLDRRQLFPQLALCVFVSAVMIGVLSQMAIDICSPKAVLWILFPLLCFSGLVTLLAVFAACALTIDMIDPVRLTIKTEGMEYYSLLRKGRWSWGQITEVESRLVQQPKGPDVRVVYLTIPSEKVPTFRLPDLLRSDAGLEDADDIYDLICAVRSNKSRSYSATMASSLPNRNTPIG